MALTLITAGAGPSRVVNILTVELVIALKRRRLLIAEDGRRATTHQLMPFMTESLDVMPKRTEQDLIVRTGNLKPK